MYVHTYRHFSLNNLRGVWRSPKHEKAWDAMSFLNHHANSEIRSLTDRTPLDFQQRTVGTKELLHYCVQQ